MIVVFLNKSNIFTTKLLIGNKNITIFVRSKAIMLAT